MRDLRTLNKFRDRGTEMALWGWFDDSKAALGGYFYIPSKGTAFGLRVIASTAQNPEAQGWDHVSVSLPNRCPTWDEMEFIKRIFFLPEEVCFQLQPAEADYINNHPYCLHIWRHATMLVPLPPPHFVGRKELGVLGP